MNSSPPNDLLQRLQAVLRRDLKLGPDAHVPPEMPFFGGDVDLDSLDILLLVTSIEKEFGVKIPSSEVGKDVFQNVTTLTNYVAANLGKGTAEISATPSPAMVDPLAQLPHGEPFRFVTRVTQISSGISAEGEWNLTGDEAFFAGHFPGNPLVPGVLLTEALAQLSGLAGGDSSKGGMLAEISVRFRRPVAPPAVITLRSRLNTTIGALQQFDVSASVNEEEVATGSLTLHRQSTEGAK